jgi:hypothetical protein
MRWLTVSVRGDHSRSMVLQVPELPGNDAAGQVA